eukprot:symbB.v1.2.001322.t1/scaffold57.1/size370615/31
MACRLVGLPLVRVVHLWSRQLRYASTEGPFLRYKAKNITWKKRHYNEVLIMADRRKLLEALQDVIESPGRKYPRAFWEILSKRCLKSMHLLEPVELSIVARAFDIHQPKLRPELDIYRPMAVQVLNSRSAVPGLAVIVLADILPRHLKTQDESRDLLSFLARRATDVMWEIPIEYAELSKTGAQDAALCRRIAKKLQVHLPDDDDVLPGRAASVFAAQDYRDLELFRRLSTVATSAVQGQTANANESAQQVLDGAEKLAIDIEEASALRSALTQVSEIQENKQPQIQE